MLRVRLAARLILVVFILFGHYYAAPVMATQGCWRCAWCSDGKTCCPSGAKWQTCEPSSNGTMCRVTKGSCSGGIEGEEDEVSPEG